MARTTRIELFKDNFKFSSGHFTIFSKTHRENLHGHNFRAGIIITSRVEEDGITFDYGLFKKKTEHLCSELNEHFLLPANSPHLKIETTETHIFAHFNSEKIPFLKRDVLVLPITNVTLEELAHWFLNRFLEDEATIKTYAIEAIEVKVFSGPGQSASANWSAE